MSKIDANAGAVEQSVRRGHERAITDERDQGKQLLRATEEQIKDAFARMIDRAKVEGSALLKLDFSATTAQLRSVLADETLKILQQVPGFVSPQLSQPPTPEELKQLLRTLLAREQDGSLQKSDAFAQSRPNEARPNEARGGFLKEGLEDAPSLKNWSQFVQSTTNAQSVRDGQALSREGLREGQAPHELHAKELQETHGAGLRAPSLFGDGFSALNNKQKLDIMSAGFGKELALALKSAEIRDPIALLKSAMTAEGREGLAKQFGLTRSQLMMHLARAELLRIGAGPDGEQALRAQHLPALERANIVTQAQLGALHGLEPGLFDQIYQSVRTSFSGFARAMSGERPILRKDLQHWAKSAARRKSSLLDAEWEEMPKRQGDAEELIMAWYLTHWGELEAGSEDRRRAQEERRELEQETREALKRGDVQLKQPNTRHDPARDDGLVCFWIERPNLDFNRPSLSEMVYVCLDPATGAIQMKAKE